MKKRLIASVFVLSVLRVVAQPAACPVPVISYTADCTEDSTQLFASSGYDSYTWFPASGLSDSTIQNPMADMSASATYGLITTALGPELVFNGDLALGNFGFISGQTFSPWYSPCNYYVAPTFFTTSFVFVDHTPTADNFFMSIDGCSPATILWEQTIPVIDPSELYNLSWWASRTDNNQPIFEMHMIGNVTGDVVVATQTGLTYTGVFMWDEYGTALWNSGANTSVTLRVVNLQTNSYGNDFAMDDFSFRKVCVDTATVAVAQGGVNAHFDFNAGCFGTASTFTDASSANASSWSWNFGDGSSSGVQNPQYVFANPGTYDVSLLVATSGGCLDSVTISVSVPELPSADFSFVDDCYNELAVFSDLSSVSPGSIDQWEWNFGDGSTSVLQNSTHQYLNSGTYTVQLIVTSTDQCKDSVTKVINRFEAPVAGFTSLTQVCEQACIPFTDLSTFVTIPITSWQWNFGNGQVLNTNNPVPCFSNLSNATDMYDVSLTVINDSGCQNTLSLTDYLEVFPKPQASFTYSPNDPNTTHSTVNFNNTSQFADSYSWSFGDSDEASVLPDPSHTYEGAAGSYVVTLIATYFNGACGDTTEAIIVIKEDPLFYIPNCFTPDGNAVNQVFQPVFSEGFALGDYHLAIFNRWGEIIFESYNTGVGWNGTYADHGLVENGVYVWDLTLTDPASNLLARHKGHVTVLK